MIERSRTIEENNLVSRLIYEQVPPKEEYSLTPHGEALRPILDQMIMISLVVVQLTISRC